MSFPHLTATVMTLVLVASTKIYQVTAQANPQSTQIAEAFVNNLERKNTAGLEQLLAPDAIFEAFDTRVHPTQGDIGATIDCVGVL